MTYSITQKIEITAGAIRSAYRTNKEMSRKLNPEITNWAKDNFDIVAADKIWMEMGRTHATKICGAFLHEATERQITRVLNLAVRGYRE